MNTARRNAVIRRSTLVAFAVAATFWGSWYLITGNVPISRQSDINIQAITVIEASRWWDLLSFPAFVAATVAMLTSSRWLEACRRLETPEYCTTSDGALLTAAGTFILVVVMLGSSIGFAQGAVLGTTTGVSVWLTVFIGSKVFLPTVQFLADKAARGALALTEWVSAKKLT